MKAFACTKEEEVAVLRHLLQKDASNPFKNPLNILGAYAPRNGLKDAVYKDVIELLYNEDMSDIDVYVSIQDLLKAVFRITAVDTNLGCHKESRPETINGMCTVNQWPIIYSLLLNQIVTD